MAKAKKDYDSVIIPILKQLHETSKDIEASAVMSRDGHSLGSALGEKVDKDRLGAMCASMLSLADRTSKELDRGNLRMVLLDGDKGCILLVHIGKNAVLSVIAKPTANLGMVFVEAKKVAREIAETGLI